ncbi:DNA gyrase inhibitor YacG [Botrimarina hoheduenensis]|uniref:DNA gyrase inhibitor YacG n=1 Tax=Botrimarina hoheduenensis TaxID=2528000 RepID=A0A5C5WCP5_9BACT|nr:DNA gyrase inhibitor YacG [Botrimarina hoheduenensis]TWT47809.1 DNA gyrase inhibitor YacG [Botrimarina hoheduenensis]
MQCPTCKKEFEPAASEAKPFCSERCRTIDLGRWLDEGQGLPHLPDPDDYHDGSLN